MKIATLEKKGKPSKLFLYCYDEPSLLISSRRGFFLVPIPNHSDSLAGTAHFPVPDRIIANF